VSSQFTLNYLNDEMWNIGHFMHSTVTAYMKCKGRSIRLWCWV